MVVRIKTGKSIHGALSYNERKVKEGTAECIGGNGYLTEVNELKFYDKLEVFMNLNERNTRTGTNTIHISLNFDPTENFTKDALNEIASSYMDKLGFSDQPYLIYEHRDAAHPHVHIVSTLIRSDGSRIPTHYQGKNESEKARKEIEKEFNLVVAQSKSNKIDESIKPVDGIRVAYGKNETKRSIERIVLNVTRNYRYTSIAELNAVLRLHNVNADRGGVKSQMFLKGGLHYSVTDDKGKRIGVPIKASGLRGKPTLKFLEKKFKENAILRQAARDPVKRIIDAALLVSSVKSAKDFSNVINSQNIRVLWRINPQGRIYGVTFVDQDRKVVFNGSDLGKAYTSNSILEKISVRDNAVVVKPTHGTQIDEDQPRGKNPMESPSQLEFIMERLAYVHSKEDRSSPESALRLNTRRRKKKRPS